MKGRVECAAECLFRSEALPPAGEAAESRPADEVADTPILRLAEHTIGLWRAARDVGDPALLEALRPLMIHIARSLARDVMEGMEDETGH